MWPVAPPLSRSLPCAHPPSRITSEAGYFHPSISCYGACSCAIPGTARHRLCAPATERVLYRDCSQKCTNYHVRLPPLRAPHHGFFTTRSWSLQLESVSSRGVSSHPISGADRLDARSNWPLPLPRVVACASAILYRDLLRRHCRKTYCCIAARAHCCSRSHRARAVERMRPSAAEKQSWLIAAAVRIGRALRVLVHVDRGRGGAASQIAYSLPSCADVNGSLAGELRHCCRNARALAFSRDNPPLSCPLNRPLCGAC
jgi:hypothetical protein